VSCATTAPGPLHAPAAPRCVGGRIDPNELESHELLLLENAARTAELAAVICRRVLIRMVRCRSRGDSSCSGGGRQLRITLAWLMVALRVPSGEQEDERPQRRGIRGVYRMEAGRAS